MKIMKTIVLLSGLLLLLGCEKDSNDFDRVPGKYKCTVVYDYWDLSGTTEHDEKTDTLTVTAGKDDNIKIEPDYDLTNSSNSYKLNSDYSYDYTEGDGIPQIHIKFIISNDSITFFSQTGGLGGRSSYTINGNKI